MSVEFEDSRTTAQIEACIDRMEQRIKTHHPQLQALFVKPQTPEAWRGRRRR